jgi:hypothetical protein
MKESESEVLKIEESELELLCTDSTAMLRKCLINGCMSGQGALLTALTLLIWTVLWCSRRYSAKYFISDFVRNSS